MFQIGQIEGGVAGSAEINAIYIERDAGIDLEVDRAGRNAANIELRRAGRACLLLDIDVWRGLADVLEALDLIIRDLKRTESCYSCWDILKVFSTLPRSNHDVLKAHALRRLGGCCWRRILRICLRRYQSKHQCRTSKIMIFSVSHLRYPLGSVRFGADPVGLSIALLSALQYLQIN